MVVYTWSEKCVLGYISWTQEMKIQFLIDSCDVCMVAIDKMMVQ